MNCVGEEVRCCAHERHPRIFDTTATTPDVCEVAIYDLLQNSWLLGLAFSIFPGVFVYTKYQPEQYESVHP